MRTKDHAEKRKAGLRYRTREFGLKTLADTDLAEVESKTRGLLGPGLTGRTVEVGVLRREIDSGGLTRNTEVEQAVKGLMDSIKIRVRDPRKQLPAEEPRCQFVHPFEARAADDIPERPEAEEGSGV